MYGSVWRTLILPIFKNKFEGYEKLIAFSIALLWSLHPLQTQSVIYIIQRCESLMGLFYIATVYFLIKGFQLNNRIYYFLSICSCYLGMGSKEVMVTAPLMAVIYDKSFLSSTWKGLIKKRWLYYLGLCSAWILLYFVSVKRFFIQPFLEYNFVSRAPDPIPPISYALTQTQVILHYIRLSIFPRGLTFDYHWPVVKSAWEAFPHIIIIISLLMLCLWLLLIRSKLAFLVIWFFLILGPTSSFRPISSTAFEHRMYLPLFSIVAFFALLLNIFCKRISLKYQNRKEIKLLLFFAITTILALSLGMLTYNRNEIYSSEFLLWKDATEKSPNNSRALYNAGYFFYQKTGDTDKAIGYAEKAIAIEPFYVEAMNFLGSIYTLLGDFSKAESHLQKALEIEPLNSQIMINLGILKQKQSKPEDALMLFQNAAKVSPYLPVARIYLGRAYEMKNDDVGAREQYETASRLDPESDIPHIYLGMLFEKQNKIKEAIDEHTKALEINPKGDMAHEKLGMLFLNADQTEKNSLNNTLKRSTQKTDSSEIL